MGTDVAPLSGILDACNMLCPGLQSTFKAQPLLKEQDPKLHQSAIY